MTSSLPVMKREAPEARKTMASAISSGSASRPTGVAAPSAFSAASSPPDCATSPGQKSAFAQMAVRTPPGWMELTRMPSPATSSATALLKSRTAPLLAQYALAWAEPTRPLAEETFTIEPPPVLRIARTPSRVRRKPPSRLTAMTRRHSASVVSSSGLAKEMPALLTRTSSRPNASSTRRSAPAHEASSLTSWRRKIASPPPRAMAAATSSPDGSRSVATPPAPSLAKRIAVALPIPDAAPVTSAVLPRSRSMGPDSATVLTCPSMALFSRRLPHVLTRKDLARILAATYAKGASVDAEEALERMERAVASDRIVDDLYAGLSAALAERKGSRTTEDELIDKLSAGVQKRRGRGKAAQMTPAISAAMVLINLELGYAPEMMRNALQNEKGRALLDEGLRALGAHLVGELIK